MRIYNVESIYPLHIQFSYTAPHNLCNLMITTKIDHMAGKKKIEQKMTIGRLFNMETT